MWLFLRLEQLHRNFYFEVNQLIRIYLVILVLIILFLGVRWLQKSPPDVVAQYLRKTGVIVLIFVSLLLAATGGLNWLFALIGIAIAFIARLMPVILRYAPALQRLWLGYKAGQQGFGQAGNGQNNRSRARSTKMSAEQAYQILGLQPGATREEIIKAHKRLMMKVHPDKGGSDFLAVQLNQAKASLLK